MLAGILSNKNREKFSYDGYIYTMDRMSTDGETIFWRCDKRTSTGCKGRIHTTAGEEREFKRLITEHSCSGVCLSCAILLVA
ncbi:hypothetical protein ACQ4LE_001880 [Meloidogyne hapla]